MIRYFTIFAWLMLLSGCPTPPSQPFEFTPAPSGQGHFIDEMGQRRTLFRTEANASIGQEVTTTVDAAQLSGVSFRAESTGRYTVTVRSNESTPINIALYGPRTETGLWGEALHERSGVGRATMSDFEVPTAGDYFVLVRVSGAAGLDVVMSIDCEGCVEDHDCIAESTCDLYCPDGFVTDADGCVECSCRGATCPVTGCPEGQVCVYPCGNSNCSGDQACEDGVCTALEAQCELSCNPGEACVDGECSQKPFECQGAQMVCESLCSREVAPVCGRVEDRQQTFTNACVADCAGASEVNSGACPECSRQNPCCDEERPCRLGQECVEGRCMGRDCGCRPAVAADAVCGESGQSHASACVARCANDEVLHLGPCQENECQSDAGCRFGQRCLPTARGAVGQRFRRCDSDDPDRCVLRCFDPPTCTLEEGCDGSEAEVTCYPVTNESGICLPRCGPDDQENRCGARQCASIPTFNGRAVGEQRVCLPPCREDADCGGRIRCLPDMMGTPVCQTCSCAGFRSIPICVGGMRYENICEATCSGLGPRLKEARRVGLEVCDQTDNDCDGRIDEDVIRAREQCDGRDNDCDGLVDEDVPDRACDAAANECGAGVSRCVDGEWSACEATAPTPEVCDGQDNDCDRVVDEEIRARPCDLEDDRCGRVVSECQAGEWTACQPRVPRAEECDGEDNDCDGRVDESNLNCAPGQECRDDQVRPLVRRCEADDVPESCNQATMQTCTDGMWGRCASIDARPEVCDRADNDCDGRTDEDELRMEGGLCEPNNPCRDCPAQWAPVCGSDRVVYMSLCEALCAGAVPTQELESCFNVRQPPVTACDADDECVAVSGMCLSQESNLAPWQRARADFSDGGRCFVAAGACQCVEETCAFVATPEVDECLQ